MAFAYLSCNPQKGKCWRVLQVHLSNIDKQIRKLS